MIGWATVRLVRVGPSQVRLAPVTDVSDSSLFRVWRDAADLVHDSLALHVRGTAAVGLAVVAASGRIDPDDYPVSSLAEQVEIRSIIVSRKWWRSLADLPCPGVGVYTFDPVDLLDVTLEGGAR